MTPAAARKASRRSEPTRLALPAGRTEDIAMLSMACNTTQGLKVARYFPRMDERGFDGADAELMRLALGEAEGAAEHGDVPIGAVIARGGEVLATAGNERELRADPTAHAEVLALRAAAERLGGWRVPEATIYVTLEPCAMCAGAIVLARIERVVYAAADPKA